MNRRSFLKTACTSLGSYVLYGCSNYVQAADDNTKPNIILCMTDDQGWGDTGYNGHPYLKTPHLDSIAARGAVFERFYSAAPVCSPTRGSCLTGRHPYRYGIFFANVGHMPEKEITLAEALKMHGYSTGHFGKWHLGTLTQDIRDANRGGRKDSLHHYSPPWENGFDECFSTESKVPVFNPMQTPPKSAGGSSANSKGSVYGTYYWTGPGKRETKNLDGDDSKIIMDRAVTFIEKAAGKNKPFLAVIWFHTPHLPVLAGDQHRKLYSQMSEDQQHYYGCITAMDEQMGRLRTTLKKLGIERNTMLWFSSDNGPEGKSVKGRNQGITKGLRGRKRSLYEGGIRVPGLLYWPDGISKPIKIHAPCCSSDYFPTIMNVLNGPDSFKAADFDGMSLLGIINGTVKDRLRAIGFQSAAQLALVDNRYKIYSSDRGKTFALYDLIRDPGETKDLSSEKPQILKEMTDVLIKWTQSCSASLEENL